MGDHSYKAGEFPPGTTFGPHGEPIGPASDTSLEDEGHPADQAPRYEEAEDLQPDLSRWDPAVVAAR